MRFEQILHSIPAWRYADGPESGIVISSRARLARNISGFPYTHRAGDDQLREIVESVLDAASGGEALMFCERYTGPIHVLVTDVVMPHMDGYAVAAELRRNPALARTPIVAVTSYAMAGDRERILAAGCNGYMEKPINPDTFIAELLAYLAPDLPTGAYEK